MAADLEALLRERVIVMDGAMDAILREKGMEPEQCPELFGIEHPDLLADIHRQYLEAGADIIKTNTLGGNRFKLAEYGVGTRLEEINSESVRIARQAAKGRALVAGCVGPTGRELQPKGGMGFDDLFIAFRDQVIVFEKAGADLILLETMSDIGEMRAAFIAARQSTHLPVIAHLSFDSGGRTMTGTDPLSAMVILDALQPLALGANCSGSARELLPVIKTMAKYTRNFLSAELNAGSRLVGLKTVFPDSPDEMAEYVLRLKESGVNIIGGGCGTTHEHIRAMVSVLKDSAPKHRESRKYFAFASRSKHVFIGPGHPLAMIGERINPTARKKLAQDIKDGEMQAVVAEARKQALLAPILDVNMGVPDIDEPLAMKQAVMAIQAALDIPLSIDSANPEAIEAGLKNFVGRTLINSTTGEEKHLNAILPLAKKYGAAVLGLCLDEKGIPGQAEERFRIANKIFQRAKEYGLREEDIFIDCLVTTASFAQSQATEVLQTLRKVKEELGLGTVLGVSNISHGLPAREVLNSTFLAMAWAAGLDLPILNPLDEKVMEVNRAAAVLMNRDMHCLAYINQYRHYKSKV